MKMSAVRRLTECAMLIALATGLSLVKFIEMPYGGSITAASMLPIVLLAYRHGTKYGLLSGLVYGVLQQLLGLKMLSYVTGWQSVVAVILLDYVVAFAVIGFAGLLRRAPLQQSLAVPLGATVASVLRYACHVIAGATVWAGLSIPTEAALLYSFSYNATFMVPETIILVCAAAYVCSLVNFRSLNLRHIVRQERAEDSRRAGVMYGVCGLVMLACIVTVTCLVFPCLQEESGELNLAGISKVPPVPTWIMIGVFFLAFVTLVAYRVRFSVKKSEKN